MRGLPLLDCNCEVKLLKVKANYNITPEEVGALIL